MDKSGLIEIGKRFKFSDCSITGLSYVIIPTIDKAEEEGNTERSPISVDGRFLTLPDDERQKFLGILSSAFSMSGMVYHESAPVTGDVKKSLVTLSRQDIPDKALLLALHDKLCQKYESPGSYALLAFSDTYDIPVKDSAKTKTGESDEVYNYICILLCPIRAEKGGLTVRDGAFHSTLPVSILQPPALSFIYPDFVDRSADEDHAFICVKKDEELLLAGDFFGIDTSLPQKDAKPERSEKKDNTRKPVILSVPDDDDDEDEIIGAGGSGALEIPSQSVSIDGHNKPIDAKTEAMLDDMDSRRAFMAKKGIAPSFNRPDEKDDKPEPASSISKPSNKESGDDSLLTYSKSSTPAASIPDDDDDDLLVSYSHGPSAGNDDEEEYDADFEPVAGPGQKTEASEQTLDDDIDDSDLPFPSDPAPTPTPVSDTKPKRKVRKREEGGQKYYMLPVDAIPYEKLTAFLSGLGLELE